MISKFSWDDDVSVEINGRQRRGLDSGEYESFPYCLLPSNAHHSFERGVKKKVKLTAENDPALFNGKFESTNIDERELTQGK